MAIFKDVWDDEVKALAKACVDDKLVEMIGSDNRGLLRRELSRLIRECKAIEKECKGALEKLCTKVVTEIFNIPEDTVFG